MADAERTSVNVFFITMALAALGIVGLGVWYLVAPGQEVDEAAGEFPERTELDGGARSTDGEARDTLLQQLVLSRYDLEQGSDVVSGTVVNNSDRPFVNVQVGFRLLSASGDSVGTVRDTASLVQSGDSWIFRAPLPPGVSASEAEHTDLQGTPKVPTTPNAGRSSAPERRENP